MKQARMSTRRSAPYSTKKPRKNVDRIEDPFILFDRWINQLRDVNKKITGVDISSHSSESTDGGKTNFFMLSQKSLDPNSSKNMILIHHKMVLPLTNQLKKMYEEIFEKSSKGSLPEAPEEIYKRELAKLYSKKNTLQQTMVTLSII